MNASHGSIRARFDEVDRGAGRTRSPRACLIWALGMIATCVLTWDPSWKLRAVVSDNLSWSGQQVLDGHLWRAVTATVLTRDLFMLGSLLIVTGVYLWLVERLTNWPAALGTWALGAVWGFLGTTVLLWVCSTAGWNLATAALRTSDYGPSGGTAALAALVVVLLRHRLVTIGSVIVLLVGSALHHQVADVEHIISFATVLLWGPIVLRRTRWPPSAA